MLLRIIIRTGIWEAKSTPEPLESQEDSAEGMGTAFL
jgi:hypothetical protein